MQNIFDFSSIAVVIVFGVFITIILFGIVTYLNFITNSKLASKMLVPTPESSHRAIQDIEDLNSILEVKRTKKLEYKTVFKGNVIKKSFLETLKILFPDNEIIYSRNTIDVRKEPKTSIEDILDYVYMRITHNNDSIIFKANVSIYDTPDIVEVLYGMEIYHSKRTKFKFDAIVKAMHRCVHIPPKNPEFIPKTLGFDVNIITKNRDGYSTSVVRSQSKIKSIEELGVMYENVDIEVKGKKYKIGLDKLMPVLIKAIQAKHNVYIMGSVGTGKTVLGSYISYIIKRENVGKLFYLNSSTIETALSPEFESAALNIFNCTVHNGILGSGEVEESNKPVNIIILDEAQIALKEGTATSDMMLSLLDGYKKQLYNTVFICLFNEQQAKINPAAFRAGRVDIKIHLKALTKTTADKVVSNIKLDIDDTEELFDDVKFKTTLESVNVLPNDTVPYAGKGEITLADVHGCVVSKSLLDVLEETLKSEKVPPPTKGKIFLEIKN